MYWLDAIGKFDTKLKYMYVSVRDVCRIINSTNYILNINDYQDLFNPLLCRHGNESVGPIEPINPTAPPVFGIGEFDVRMRIYEDNFFHTPITDFPYQVCLAP